jgi:hypothetical protein
MAKRVKYIPNAPLEKGDKVVCIKMDDEYSPVAGGTPGIVKSVSDVMGTKQYYVDWRSGSRLALIDGVDQWRKVVEIDDEESEDLTEGYMFFTTKRAILKEIKK